MVRETLARVRAGVGKIARLLLGYSPPPDVPRIPLRDRLAWLRSAGGYGAAEIYSYGLALAVLLSLALISYAVRDALVSAEPGDDGATAGWGFFVMTLLYFTGSGFLAARRRRSIALGAVVGAVTAAIGVGGAYLTFVAILVIVSHRAIAIAVFPILLPLVALGFLCGVLGGALALPEAACRAIREGLRES